jgi:predicted SprT family Zn-dependent metalloprotease
VSEKTGEQFQEVRSYKVSYICECKGEVLPTREMLMSNPPQFPHKCNKCGKEYVFDKKYPYIAYELVSPLNNF